MKKLLIAMMALCVISLTSCHKNPAEKYVGTYTLTSTENYNLAGVGKANDAFSNEEHGTMTIHLVGNDGHVIVEGDVFNTTGYVDEDGVLHLDNESHAYTGANVSLFGQNLVSVEVLADVAHHSTSLDGATLTWSSSGTGSFQTYLGTVPLVGGNATVSFSNNAVRQ